MKLVNADNVRAMVPDWAVVPEALAAALEGVLTQLSPEWLADPGAVLPFWVEVNDGGLRVCEPDDKVDLRSHLLIEGQSPLGGKCQVDVPLNDLLSGIPDVEGKHYVYLHAINTETPLGYFGVTKQRWFARLSQHLSQARAGSNLLFHRAIREHPEVLKTHRVIAAGFDFMTAMQWEEEYVQITLYPNGLNMIPGGLAGLRYLQQLGFAAQSAKQRDVALAKLVSMETVKGRPNPLCVARWETDQDFVNRVICGHSGRLTTEQVRAVRLLVGLGYSPAEIAATAGIADQARVTRILSGRRYSRVR